MKHIICSLLLFSWSFVQLAHGLTCSPGDLPTFCGDFQCTGASYNGCSVSCNNGCNSAEFTDSVVECRQFNGCYVAEFTRSTVDCAYSQCHGATFYSSAVDCAGLPIGSSMQDEVCYAAAFLHCSCCDGESCPSYVPSCIDDIEAFCSSEYLGASCKALGNPACKDVDTTADLPPTEPPVEFPTSMPAAPPADAPSIRPSKSPAVSTDDPTEPPVKFPISMPVAPPADAPSVRPSKSPLFCRTIPLGLQRSFPFQCHLLRC